MSSKECVLWEREKSMLNYMKSIIRFYFYKSLSNLDKTAAIILICFSAFIVILSISKGHYGIQLPGLVFLSCLYYLSKGEKSTDISMNICECSRWVLKLNNILFIILITLASLLSWYTLYYRSILYFCLLLLIVISIIIDIITFHNSQLYFTVIFMKIFFFSLLIYLTIYYEFPCFLGIDPWIHYMWIQETLVQGFITKGDNYNNSYYFSFIFHITILITQILTNMSFHNAFFASIGIPMALSSLYVYNISKRFLNIKSCLLASMIVSLCSDNIERSVILIPMSLGYFYYLNILFIINLKENDPRMRFLMVILFLALIMTHPIASLSVLIFIMLYFVGQQFVNFMKLRNFGSYNLAGECPSISLTTITLLSIILLAQWMRTPFDNISFLEENLRGLLSSMQLYQFALDIPFEYGKFIQLNSLLSNMGVLILLPFSVIGSLFFLKTSNLSTSRISLILFTGILIILPFFFGVMNVYYVLPERWQLFLYVPLAILGVRGFINIFSDQKDKRILVLAMISLVMITSLFSLVLSGSSNADSPIIFNNAVRFGYTQSEFNGIKTLSVMNAGIPITDLYYGAIIPYIIGFNKFYDMIKKRSYIYIQRNYYLKNPEWNNNYLSIIYYGDKSVILKGNRTRYIGPHYPELYVHIFNLIGLTNRSIIYNNGDLKAFIGNDKINDL